MVTDLFGSYVLQGFLKQQVNLTVIWQLFRQLSDPYPYQFSTYTLLFELQLRSSTYLKILNMLQNLCDCDSNSLLLSHAQVLDAID